MSGPGSHHTAFLLAILIGILLLLSVACVLLLCYCREKCCKLERHRRKTRITDRLTREQATSMTCVSLNYAGPPSLPFYGLCLTQHSLGRLTECSIQFALQGDPERSCTTGKSWTTDHSQQGMFAHPEVVHTELHSMGEQKREISIHGSRSHHLFSSCPSVMECALRNGRHLECFPSERPSRRCSSTLNSHACSDLLLGLHESTIPDASCLTNHLGTTSRLECCTTLSETTSHQEFVWGSSTLTSTAASQKSLHVLGQQSGRSDLQNLSKHSESLSLSVPNTLQRPLLAAENMVGNGCTRQSMAQLPKPCGLLPPVSWFIFLGNTSVPETTAVSKKDTQNVASVDSGVDVIQRQTQRICAPEVQGLQTPPGHMVLVKNVGTLETKASCDCVTEELHSSGPRANIHTEGTENNECKSKQPIAHAEFAVNLHQVNSGNKRSLWQKWDERPLIGIN